MIKDYMCYLLLLCGPLLLQQNTYCCHRCWGRPPDTNCSYKYIE